MNIPLNFYFSLNFSYNNNRGSYDNFPQNADHGGNANNSGQGFSPQHSGSNNSNSNNNNNSGNQNSSSGAPATPTNNPLAHLNDTVNSLDPLNAMEKSLNEQMPHTPNTPHTPGNGGNTSHPMTPIGGPPSVNNNLNDNSPHSNGGSGMMMGNNNSNNNNNNSNNHGQGNNTNMVGLNETDLTSDLNFGQNILQAVIDGEANSDLNVS